jgi:undecaprenyl-diphosphatase
MQFLESLDQQALYFFQHHRLPWLNVAAIIATELGDNQALFAAAAAFILGLMARGRWRKTAVVLATAGLLGWSLSEGVKALVARPRPVEAVDMLVPMPSSPSFPSGHALNAMSVYGTAALLAARGLRRRASRAWLLTIAFVLAGAIGASRLYLCVHYLTDVLGGWCAGLALALLARWVDERLTPAEPAEPERPPGPAPPPPERRTETDRPAAASTEQIKPTEADV